MNSSVALPAAKTGALSPGFHVAPAPGSDVLIVSFSGLAGSLAKGDVAAARPFDFFMTTKMLDYNRISVRDPFDLFYLQGVDENGFDHFVARLRREIAGFSAKKVIFIGASAGGYAAVLFGHLLGADYVHAFGTRGHFNLSKIILQGDFKSIVNRLPTIYRMARTLPPQQKQYLDLRAFMRATPNPNPRTRFHLHACAQCVDASRARYLAEGRADMRVYLYPCNQHNVAAILVKSHCLTAMLQEDNLDSADDIFAQFYGPDRAGQKPSQHAAAEASLLLPGSRSPDGRYEVHAVMAGPDETAGARLELRESQKSKVIGELATNRWMPEIRAHTLRTNTEVLWSPDGNFLALKMRDTKNSSRVSCFQLREGTLSRLPAPLLLEEIRRDVGCDFEGRFYFESVLKWQDSAHLLLEVRGNTVKSIDPDGQYDYRYEGTILVETGALAAFQAVKRSAPPPSLQVVVSAAP